MQRITSSAPVCVSRSGVVMERCCGGLALARAGAADRRPHGARPIVYDVDAAGTQIAYTVNAVPPDGAAAIWTVQLFVADG